MKSFLTSATIVATLCAVTLLPSQANAQASRGTTVAVIDIGMIFKTHPGFKQKLESIKGDIQAFEAFVVQQRKDLQAKVDRLQSGELRAGSPEFKQVEEQIAQGQTNLKLQMARKRDEFLKQEAKVYFIAYKEIQTAVQQFSDRYGIDLVLRFSSDQIESDQRDSVLKGVNRAVVFQRQLNITGSIMKMLPNDTAVIPGPTPR